MNSLLASIFYNKHIDNYEKQISLNFKIGNLRRRFRENHAEFRLWVDWRKL